MTTLTTPPPIEAALLDTRAVAAMLRCSPRHVTRLRDAGQMPPAVKLGRLCRWSREAIEAWINSGCPADEWANGPQSPRR
jgi:excisionase family DNA binding protein